MEQKFKYKFSYYLAIFYAISMIGAAVYLIYSVYNGSFDWLISNFGFDQTTLYLICGLICLPFLLLGVGFILVVLFQINKGQQFLIITDETITFPSTLIRKTTQINFSDIKEVKMFNYSGTTFINLITDNKKFGLTDNHFNAEDFNKVVKIIKKYKK